MDWYVYCFVAIGWCWCFFFFSSRRRHTRCSRDWSSDVCSSDLAPLAGQARARPSAADADLHVAEAGGRGAVRDVRVLSRLALAAVRETAEHPLVRSGNGVERGPEDGRLARVGRVAQHPAELAVLDLPGDLRPELEVEPLVVDRPALVRLEVDALVDAGDQLLERAFARLEV